MSSSESENTEAAPSASNVDNLIEDGKNKSSIFCERCNSLILKPQAADFQKKEFFLPMMRVKPDAKPDDEEKLNDFWLVSDMFTFENLGFTNTLNDIKYLICADCEVGPIGLHNVTQKNRFYIALDRVHHGD